MTLTAKEAMQALLDGREVYRRDGNDPEYIHTYKLSGEGKIVEQCDDKWWGVHTELNHIDGIVDEYPLDFEHALIAMLVGMVVVCEKRPDLMYRFHNGTFENCDGVRYEKGESCAMFIPEQKAKWKVIE